MCNSREAVAKLNSDVKELALMDGAELSKYNISVMNCYAFILYNISVINPISYN